MSIFDNANKDDLEYEISEFLESHTINELLEVVKYCIESKEDTYIEHINTLKEQKDGNNSR